MQSKGKGNLSLDEVFLTASVKTITNYDFLPVVNEMSTSTEVLDFNP